MTFRNENKKRFQWYDYFCFLSEYLYRKPLFLLQKNGRNYKELTIKIL